jgi:ribose transport system ATP-binding protein
LSFDLEPGEILGLFGLVGAGRTELIETLFGLRRASSGSIALGDDVERSLDPRRFAPRHPMGAIAAGLALVPEDRKVQGLVAEMSISENLSLAANALRSPLAWRRRAKERRLAEETCARLDIRPPRPEIEARRLSGGNQQKVVLGKWLALSPRVLLLDEPTRGVDVSARAEIHRLFRELADTGVAIVLSSAETEEILALASRVVVLRRGEIAGVLAGSELSDAALLRLAAGASTAIA